MKIVPAFEKIVTVGLFKLPITEQLVQVVQNVPCFSENIYKRQYRGGIEA